MTNYVAQLPPLRLVDYPYFNVSQLAHTNCMSGQYSSYAVLLYSSVLCSVLSLLVECHIRIIVIFILCLLHT